MDFLDMEARLGGEFLHPGAHDLTMILIDRMTSEPVARVLEVGGGTGATANLIARHTHARVTLLDRSAAMLKSAYHRLGTTTSSPLVELLQADADLPWPFRSDSFDALYAESVVALLDTPHAITEMVRVLRSGGRLWLNERIWRAGTTQHVVDNVNALSRRIYGFPAATSPAHDCAAWQRLLRESGLCDVQAEAVDDLLPTQRWPVPLRHRLLRAWRYVRQPELIAQSLVFKRRTRQSAAAFAQLDSYLFSARKPL